MPNELTKEARKTLKRVYDLYLERRKAGKSKSVSIYFDAPGWGGGITIEGMDDTSGELSQAGFIKADITGGFELTDKALTFMESFKKDMFIKWVEFGTQFIP